MLKTLRLGQAPGVTAFDEPSIRTLLTRNVVEELRIDLLETIEDDRSEKVALGQLLEGRQVERLIEELELLFIERLHLLGQDVLCRSDANSLSDH